MGHAHERKSNTEIYHSLVGDVHAEGSAAALLPQRP